MDLIEILRRRIDALDVGAHTPGLRAVLQHVEVAEKHLVRGTEDPDDSAFTDAIYRTNQAFEGSLKEAFRVLARKDPDKVRPFEIEEFLQEQSILRSRVLDQMSRYRTEWRNPSTHDYKLDFDEDEALLAIASVCAFAIVLLDQITEKLNFDRAKAAAPPTSDSKDVTKPLAEAVAEAVLGFRYRPTAGGTVGPAREVELVGALAGHLETVVSGTKIQSEARLSRDRAERADLLVERDGERVILEVKRRRFSQSTPPVGLSQMAHYVALSGIRDAILYLFQDAANSEMERKNYPLPNDGRIIVIGPKRKR